LPSTTGVLISMTVNVFFSFPGSQTDRVALGGSALKLFGAAAAVHSSRYAGSVMWSATRSGRSEK